MQKHTTVRLATPTAVMVGSHDPNPIFDVRVANPPNTKTKHTLAGPFPKWSMGMNLELFNTRLGLPTVLHGSSDKRK